MQPSRSPTLEVNMISAEQLRLHGHSINKNTFATVQTDPNNQATTKMDKEDGSYPLWEETFNLQLPSLARSINVRVQCKTWTGIEVVGTANVPVSDFMGDYTPPQYLHFLSYRLRDGRGRRNGIVNLSVRVREPWEGTNSFDQQGDQKINFGGFTSGVPNSFKY